MATNIKTLKDSNGDIIAPRTTVGAVYLEDLETTIENALDQKATTNLYTGVLDKEAWVGTDAPYSQEVTVTGILDSDYPIVDIDLTTITNFEDKIEVQNNWGLIVDIDIDTNKMTFYATEELEVDIPFLAKVVR